MDSSGRPVLNRNGESIGVYRQEVSARQRAENETRGKGRNIVWSSNTKDGDDYPYSRGRVVERFHEQACIRKQIGPGFRLTEYGREMVANCASRPSVIEPPNPVARGLTARERRKLRRQWLHVDAVESKPEPEPELVNEEIVDPVRPWTDRELFERMSESPKQRETRLKRSERIEKRIAKERALDEVIGPILERARARDDAAREKRRARRISKGQKK